MTVPLRYHDHVVDKEQLVKLVWPDRYVSDDSLTHSVSVLRRALGDDSAQPVYIVTVPRRAYRLAAPVIVEAATHAPEAARYTSITRRPR